MNIYSKLAVVQKTLKAPKDQRNTFGNYNYRSCEDILEAVKPIMSDLGLALIITDSMVECGGRVYVRAEAALFDTADSTCVSSTAFAREEETKKGMDASQVTGAASSYARKYALNGLFCIDDTKDADATNTGDKCDKPAEKKPFTPAPDGDFQPVCADCGREIDVRTHDYSVKYYKRPLCRDCQKNASANR